MTIIDEQLVKKKIFKKQYRDLISDDCIMIECNESMYNTISIRIKIHFTFYNEESPNDAKYRCSFCIVNPAFENRIFTSAFIKTKESEKCVIKIGEYRFHFTYSYQSWTERYTIDLVSL